MGFSASFLDELRSRLSLVEVVGRRVKLLRRGREHLGLCPFHNEKTPSFTVSDEKGFFHCFGCGAHGDVITFVQDTEGVGFRDAVERLASLAGMVIPAPSPQAARDEARRLTLIDANEAAAQWFAEQLRGSRGEGARGYLAGRGLNADTVKAFALGYAPPGRTLLKQALVAKGFEELMLVEAGLLIAPEEGGESFDRFRNRLMFPIRDRRGRVVAFGGRALDDAPAKYLNSPETALFHKGSTLYNLDQAQGAARQHAAVIVAEGYMDVIALAQAGFGHAVAPLGTALTEDQLKLLWRMAPEPVLCFDGDQAGARAAWRAAERALPLLSPGHSLRFALLPAGSDPDDLIRDAGAAAMQQLIDQALPLAELLWRTLTQHVPVDTPERRAGLERDIFAMLAKIEDPTLKRFYGQEMHGRLAALWRSNRLENRRIYTRRAARGGAVGRSSGLLAATMAARAPGGVSPTRALERVILATVINHPSLLPEFIESLGAAHFASSDIDKAIRSLISLASTSEALDSQGVKDNLQRRELTALLADLTEDPLLRRHGFAAASAQPDRAAQGLAHCLARLRRLVDLERERAEAEAALSMTDSPEAWERLRAVQAALNEPDGLEVDFDNTPRR